MELDLGADPHTHPGRSRRGHLVLQDPAWRHRDRYTGIGDEIAHDESGARQPREAAHRREVGERHHVAVAGVVTGHVETGHGHIVEIPGDQVVAVLGAVLGDPFDEVPGVGAFADETPLMVGERHDHRVDRTVGDGGHQIAELHPDPVPHAPTVPGRRCVRPGDVRLNDHEVTHLP